MKTALACGLLVLGTTVQAYPLDATERTGIRRLALTEQAQQQNPTLPAGARLPSAAIRLNPNAPAELPPADTALSAALREVLGEQADNYAVALLDMSLPGQPAFAAHRPDELANVGSVGKILVALAWLQRLQQLYPDDIPAREKLLRETQITADEYIEHDHHEVPITVGEPARLESRRLRTGDRGNLWEYLDWMLSASSNAAAAMLMKELVALAHFGRDYPADESLRNDYLRGLNPQQRGQLLLAAMQAPLSRNGLRESQLRQGSVFTRTGKARISGGGSHATPRELVRMLLKIDSGQFGDRWASEEAKRLLYMSQKRIRYASHPALNRAAVYFKSGSLYSCEPEPGFVCRKYMGNKVNRLASVAIVEDPAGEPRLRYAVAVMSNVLRVNSAVAHQTLALRIHRLIEARHQALRTDQPASVRQP